MLRHTQYLRGWSRLCSLYQCRLHHYQLLRQLTSSAAKSESDCNSDKGNSFGQLAGSIQKKSLKRKANRSTDGVSKPVEYSSRKEPSSLRHDTILEKWHQLRDAENKDTVVRGSSGCQEDAKDDYRSFVSKRGSKIVHQDETYRKISSAKDSSEKILKSEEKDSSESLYSERAQQNCAEQGGTFGRLRPQPEEAQGDEGDLREEKFHSTKLERKHRPHFYGFKMKKLCKERKLSEAIKILEEEMPRAGTKPDSFCFQVLINACGRAGYTKKAFQLYNQMKKRNLEVQPVAYTGLFLACAHSPWPTTDGLQRATHLRSLLKERRYQFNQIVFHAMIKAFGWCGDMGTAFMVVDEMIEEGVLVTTETINFLLQACITNKEVGFRHAVTVWRKMRKLKLRPDIYSYNLLMRIVKECGAGDADLTSDLLSGADPPRLIEKHTHENHHNLASKVTKSKVDSQCVEKDMSAPEDSIAQPEKTAIVENVRKDVSAGGVLPNIIGWKVTRGNVVALGALNNPPDRLALVGGPSGVLVQMKKDRVAPDLKTFTHILESLPPDTLAEDALLESIKNVNMEPDTQFFNMLIKKRIFRQDAVAAEEVIGHMQQCHATPDIITFGCLALGCLNLKAANQLLKDMDSSQFRPNQVIMSSLIGNSLFKQDYHFTVAMLKEMQDRAILPNDFLLTKLEAARTKARNSLLEKHGTSTLNITDKKSAKKFLSAYKVWLQHSQVDLPEHPWTQYL